jgi:signal transduction histidine kinase
VSVRQRLVMMLRSDDPTPTLKHVPTTVIFLAALGLTLAVPELKITDYASTYTALWIMAISTAFAAFLTMMKSLAHLAVIVPCLDLIAIGFLRVGTGGTASLFSALIILPVIWIAALPGRRHIFIAAAGTSIALMLPFILGVATFSGPADWLRGIISPVIFALTATIINEMSRQSRLQVDRVRALAEERETMLQGAVTYAERLRENEELLTNAEYLTRSVLDSVTEQSVIGTDVTGLIDVWNPGAERMLGLSARATQGKRYVYEFHDQDELDGRSKELSYPPGETVLTPGFSALVESARLGTPEVRQWTYVRDDGTTLSVEIAVTRRADQAGATVGYIFVATDVTQALEVSRLKDEFVGLISHELRTPLSSILGYLELMRDDDENPLSTEQLQYLGVAERNAHRLLRLVGDLLFTAQVGSSTFSLDASLVDIGPIVTASVESAEPVAANAGVRISADILTGGQQIMGDPVRLAQACDNLLSNAIKFTPRGGSVAIIVAAVGSSIEVTITDTGMGIPEDELDNLFARFFRASTATRAAVPGVGLGLTITKAIIVAHGGELDVTSMVGVGTSFVVRLPIPSES